MPHLKLFRKDRGNEVCHLTLAPDLGDTLNSPRSPDPVNSGNYNSNSSRYDTTIHPVTLQPDTDPGMLEYSFTSAGVLTCPTTNFLFHNDYITGLGCTTTTAGNWCWRWLTIKRVSPCSPRSSLPILSLPSTLNSRPTEHTSLSLSLYLSLFPRALALRAYASLRRYHHSTCARFSLPSPRPCAGGGARSHFRFGCFACRSLSGVLTHDPAPPRCSTP